MGYGKQAMKLLKSYYAGKFTQLDENDEAEDDEEGNRFLIDLVEL